MIEKLFEKVACVREWYGDPDRRLSAEWAVAAVPESSFLIGARVGDVFVDMEENGVIDFITANHFAEVSAQTVYDEGWHTLTFEKLRDILIEIANIEFSPEEKAFDKENHITTDEIEVFLIQNQSGILDEEEITTQRPVELAV